MAESAVEIVNEALALLGDDPITALNDNTERARLANRIYTPTVDQVLRMHPWNCAVVRRALSQNATAPIFEWTYAYDLPTDPWCLRVLETDLDDDDLAWQIEGRTLVTDQAAVKIKYIGRITDPAKFDALCATAISARLAAKMTYAITEHAEHTERLWALFERVMKEAKSTDGQEGTPRTYRTTSLTEIR